MASMASYFPVPFHLQNSAQPMVTAPVAVAPIPVPVSVPAYLGGMYSLPQHQQAQQLFQKDAQIITPEALESVKAALASSELQQKVETKKRALPCKAAGQTWEDPTLADWPEKFLLFAYLGRWCKDPNCVGQITMIFDYSVVIWAMKCDDVLTRAFSRFPSFNMARVVRDKRTGKTKGYGFVSFANSSDLVVALKEMNGKYVGNRPIKLRKSTWKIRVDFESLERRKKQIPKKQKPVKKSILHK